MCTVQDTLFLLFGVHFESLSGVWQSWSSGLLEMGVVGTWCRDASSVLSLLLRLVQLGSYILTPFCVVPEGIVLNCLSLQLSLTTICQFLYH